MDREYLSPLRGSKAYGGSRSSRQGGAIGQHPIGAGVIANRWQFRMRSRDFASLALESESRLDGLGCANSGSADKLGRQGWMLGTEWVVGRLMQLDSVLFLVRKPVQRDRVETGRVGKESPFEYVSLRGCWSKLKANRALHNLIVSYAVRYCKRKEIRAVSSVALAGTLPA
jgi:hypothetical protein